MALYKEAFTTKEALFTADLTKSNSIISKAAIHDGIKGTFALPVFQKREVMGVFELFKKEVFDLEPELGWVDLMKIIGNQFTVFIERRESHLLDKELTALVSTTSDGIYKVDLDLNIRTWNLGAQVIYGYLPEEIIGQKVEMLYPKEHVFELKNIQESLLKFKTIEHFQTVRKTKNNQKIWVENSYAPIVNEKGKVCAYSVISRDITQQKAVSDALKLNEEKFRHFVESTQSWLWEVDLVGNFTFSNNASLELLGYSLDEIRNLNWKSLFLEKDKLEKDFIELRAKPNSWKKKLIQVLSKNGSVLWLESSVEEVRNQNLEPIGYRGVCRDVTKEVKIDISKNEFISMVSHELRTPLTSIIGAIGLMKVKKEMDVESIELLDLADRNADRLLKLINDILDIEKLSLGKILLNNKNYEFSNVIHEAINIARTQAEKENIQIKEEKIFNNIFIYVDQDRLVQVILNLLSNAIKFSPKNGFIVVSNERRDGFIRLNIKDFGPGIPYEIQGRLFEKFVQGQTGDTKVKGTGLGLNISKALIEQMGGSIGFTSQPTMGSTFFIDLPITKQGA